jgi:hypothetical protein
MVATLWLAALALAVLFTPVAFFLFRGWTTRRDELLNCFTEAALLLYFKRFFPAVDQRQDGVRAAFSRHHNVLFGRGQFVLPLFVLAVVAGIALLWCADSIAQAAGDKGLFWRPLSPIPVAALLGAYVWILFEFISESVRRTLSTSNILWATFRIAIAAPLAGAVTSMFEPGIGLSIAFLLGSFPTQPLMVLVRRLATKKLGLGDEPEGLESEVQGLDSIDRRTAERLADENVTAVVQMAYCNVVEISIRTGMRLDVVADYAGQALVWDYLGKDAAKLRPLGIRGASEVADLWTELNSEEAEDAALRRTAEKTLVVAAGLVGVDAEAFRNTVAQIAEDPYTIFLCSIWGLDEDEEESEATGGEASS